MEVIFQGPIFVNNLDYDSYLAAHREDVERLRAEVERVKHQVEAPQNEWKDEKAAADIGNDAAGQNV
jgi:hypothetical protein